MIKLIIKLLRKYSNILDAMYYYSNAKYFNFSKIKFRSIGKKCMIHPDCRISDPSKLIIGDNVFIQNSILNTDGCMYIGNNSGIGQGCIIWTVEHEYRKTTSIPFSNNLIVKPVIINDNVWVGVGSIILPGVEIGEGAIVSAGSVVTKDVSPCSIVFGVPAKVIGHRDKNEYLKLKDQNAFVARDRIDNYIVPKFVIRRKNFYKIVQEFIDSGKMILEKEEIIKSFKEGN